MLAVKNKDFFSHFLAVNDMSDSASSCSDSDSEGSYYCTSWKGALSTSWQSLSSTNSTLMLPSVSGGVGASGSGANFGSEDASSLRSVGLLSIFLMVQWVTVQKKLKHL